MANARIEALAEAWASMDGKLEQYVLERDTKMNRSDSRYRGNYEGYLVEAEEVIKRLNTRGFDVTPLVRES